MRASGTLLAIAAALTLRADGQVEQCRDSPGLQGYMSITAMNSEMRKEFEKIVQGGSPEKSYSYMLCPETVFDATAEPLLPLLSNMEFSCGAKGLASENCVIFGGHEQVRFADSTSQSYPLEQVSFVGLTFANFTTNDRGTGTSIAAFASSTTTASFMNVKFTVSTWPKFIFTIDAR
jgi:hypothetical protein